MLPIILVSKDKKDRDNFVKKFIKENNFSESQIFKTFPLKSEILISQIREIRKELTISTPSPRLFILYDFNKATLESQNALLKSLEEQGLKNQFILVVSNEYSILPTVQSRSKIVRLDKKLSGNKKDQPYSNLIENLESSKNYKFLSDKTLANISREDAADFFIWLILYYRKKLSSSSKSAKIIKEALRLKALLENNNLNPQLTCDNLLIFIFKTFRIS